MQKRILHIDGDSFFASCEVALDHTLRGKPVVTGRERGIATAMSKEAKSMGIERGMPIHQIKKLFPTVVIRSSDYQTYEIFSQRMFAILRRYTDVVEEYSIDECFADLTHLDKLYGLSYRQLLEKIKSELQSELGMTFSLGLAPTKVLAKVASKWNKPDGLTILERGDIEGFLDGLLVGKIWGIGPATARALEKSGISTALEFINTPRRRVGDLFNKPVVETWHELRGESIYRVHAEPGEDQQSIQKTRTFTPPTTDKSLLLSELSKNIEAATVKLRLSGLMAIRVYYFLKTQEFRYHRFEVTLDTATSNPAEIMRRVKETFPDVYKPRTLYRATGVTLSGLIPADKAQNDLFGSLIKGSKWEELFGVVDGLDRRFGSHSLVLGSSMKAFKRRGESGFYRRLRIPYMGEVV
jgi:DNA polymerase IV